MLQQTLAFIATAGAVLAVSGIGLSAQVRAATAETARRRMLAPRSTYRRGISVLEIGGVLSVVLLGALVVVAAQVHFGGEPSLDALTMLLPE